VTVPDDGEQHLPTTDSEPNEAQARHVQFVQAVDQHMVLASRASDELIARTQTLVRNGVDLRHPDRVGDFLTDQVLDAVRIASVHDCGCAGAQGAAALALAAELARRIGELTRDR
jgi:hypothetical protein